MRFFALLLFTPSALAWGAVGHEVVATIAQIHLQPPARAALAQLLPASQGHLGPIASWADRMRFLLPWASELHYTSPLEDNPPTACHFGDAGWKTDHDVLHAIANYTTRLAANHSDGIALRFLVHFLGDVHQPLHLTNRDRGGNLDRVRFEGRLMNLHSLWDGQFIARALREQSNYTSALPSPQIENELRGTIYDPYIRLLLWEGVRSWWRTSLPSWFDCPSPFSASTLTTSSSQSVLAVHGDPRISSVVCPETWATETHKITCALTFPPGMGEGGPEELPMELNTPEYYGPIKNGKIIEKQLVQGGLRLAATLNAIFAPRDGAAPGREGLLDLSWLEEAETHGL